MRDAGKTTTKPEFILTDFCGELGVNHSRDASGYLLAHRSSKWLLTDVRGRGRRDAFCVRQGFVLLGPVPTYVHVNYTYIMIYSIYPAAITEQEVRRIIGDGSKICVIGVELKEASSAGRFALTRARVGNYFFYGGEGIGDGRNRRSRRLRFQLGIGSDGYRLYALARSRSSQRRGGARSDGKSPRVRLGRSAAGVVELRSGGNISIRVDRRFLQEGQVGRTTADPSMPVSGRLPRVGSATLAGQLSEGARMWQSGQYLSYHPPHPEKTFSRFPIRVLKMRSCAEPSVCSEVRLVPKAD
ncbi:hypothetical protein B296_00048886 [Ensete ventricosum]|uniref:Uncharacterized protein n=1 Tax=Ensete ventricosum TaxID=4639 RepID=A0A426XK35_ENSVE|nr:hypothetical protein B296_00048886 [Ensete ventricosum]